MSDSRDTSERAAAGRRRLRRVAIWAAAIVAVLAGLLVVARVMVALPPGRAMIAAALDGRAVGRLGVLEVDGLAGDVLRDARIARLAITDAEGTWLVVEDAHLRWRPGALLGRRVHVEMLEARRVEVARRPALGEGGGGDNSRRGGGWGARIDAAELPQIVLGEDLLGARAELAAALSAQVGDEGAIEAVLDVSRTDAPDGVAGDALSARLRRAPAPQGDPRLEVDLDLTAPAGGPLSRLARLSSQTLVAHAEIAGDAAAAEGVIDATLDGAAFVDASGRWDGAGGGAEAHVQFAAAPELAALTERFGPEARVELTLGSVADGLRALTLEGRADNLEVSAEGEVDLAARAAPNGLAFTASSARLDRLIDDTLPERIGLAFGAATAEGRAFFDDGLRIEGTVAVDDAAYRSFNARRVSGAVTAAYDGAESSVDGDLTAEGVQGPAALSALLGVDAQVSAHVNYDYATRVLAAPRWRLTGDAGEAEGRAQLAFATGALSAEAEGRLTGSALTSQIAGGALDVQATAERAARGAPFEITARGTGDGIALASGALNELVGGAPDAALAFTYQDGAARISSASLDGAAVALEAGGALGRETGFDLDIDASLEGPSAAGPAALEGAMMVAARLEGAIDAPTLRLDARAGALGAGPVALRDPRLRVELSDLAAAPTGRFTFDASSDSGPMVLSADISKRGDVFAAEDIIGSWRGLEVSGDARGGAGGAPEADLVVLGFDDSFLAELRATAKDDGPRIELTASANDLLLPDGGEITALALSASGPLDRVAFDVSAQGFTARRFALAATGEITRGDGATRIAVAPAGTVGGVAVAAPTPWTASFSSDATTIAASLEASGGALEGSLERAEGRTRIDVNLDDAPLSLINLVRPEPRLEGRATASITLEGADFLEGEADLRIADASAPDRAPDDSLDAELMVAQDATGADLVLTASDGAGFEGRLEGRAPLTLAAWPPRPRFDRDAPAAGSADVNGDVAALWALFGVREIAVSGDLTARGSLAGSMREPTFEGAAGVRNGHVEDGRLGLLLNDLSATARLEGPRVVVENAEAVDGDDGRVTGNGQIEFGGEPGSETRARLDLDSLQAVRTGENQAVVSGWLEFARDAEGARVEGDLEVDRAEITPPQRTEQAAGVVTLDVVELNRPEDLAPPPASHRFRIGLDVAVSAERRIFLRTRGLDTEWAIDATITGTNESPQVRGSATLVRGDLQIAGERFELDSAEITFNGDPEDARIDLTALRESTDISVTARITGTAAQPQIALESTPSYPQDEILARVLYGRSTSELSAFEAAQLASALASLAGGGGVDLLGPLRESLGVDRLSVRSSETGGALVAGGRYIADDVYLEVGSTSTGAAQAAIEWEIRPRLELVSRFGATQDTSVSLRWRYDY